MNDAKNLLFRIRSGSASWVDFSAFLELESKELEPYFFFSQDITKKNFNNTLKIYNPNKKFPAISITGSECSLHCEHCNEKYLKGMKPILTNDDLESFLIEHSQNNGIGVLISGGCNPDGTVPLKNFLDTVKKVKKKRNLIINTHTGLLDEETAQKLAEANVEMISFDINLDKEIIENIYHLDKGINDYKKAVELLKKYKLNIVPHICIGLYYGKLHKELESIKFIKEAEINPSLIVLIALIPPKSSKVNFQRLNPIDIAKVIAVIRFVFPYTEISLGCMRPRGEIKNEVERYAIKAGVNRIELPSPDTLKWVKSINPEINFKFFSACCAIPTEYEIYAKSKDSDIKRYLSI
ncbi:MAG: radical SAM protein [Promethearchaeota archaeon]|nr:MAG: radical SAM protein [Candidatus Lokiarchaeota archaeon]